MAKATQKMPSIKKVAIKKTATKKVSTKKVATKKTATKGLGSVATTYAKDKAEAKRYIDNAKKILSEKAGKNGNYYTDKKYVRMAGHTAWCGVQIALDTIVPPVAKNKRRSIEHYQRNVSAQDKKLLTDLNNLYEGLHLVMGYDGNLNYPLAKSSLELAYQYIDKVFRKHGI